MRQLPAEVILHIIECLIPSAHPVAFPPVDPVTQTLISLTLVSSLTHHTAKRLLLKHCLHLDSSKRLDSVLSRLLTDDGKQQAAPTGLFLAPFPGNNLEEPHVVKQVDQLSSHICGSLRRLVIDVPLRYLYPDEDVQGLRKIIRAAFVRLTELEEFCSVQDEMYCDTIEDGAEPPVWSLWPRLKHLALYNQCVDRPLFLQALQGCTSLTHLVLTRPDSLADPIDSGLEGLRWWSFLKRIVIINTARDHEIQLKWREPDWPTSFLGCLVRLQHPGGALSDNLSPDPNPVLEYISIDLPPGREEDDIDLCQEFVHQHAVQGTLWSYPGSRYSLDD
ncbi:hypothetical protein AFCA_006620 [Aspergillus flavus]|uniref:F-box domain-containing protein n=1 Tax=Aspergillus flavus TaxID=5059 RepID=A0AB74BWV6_ASPFL|nr:hypothetical protein COH20_004342 [Aspergillus flavus]RAQ79237.1 hypothetical protein COH21_007412 [Aspergillus flavus]RMZ38923.1 hypothetical protein CA14_003215 [Aspergillus flavus]UDD59198.1 hypothetical protein AFCA_006620 [Aspergillus flavus]